MRRLVALAPLTALALAWGCGGMSEKDLVGDWTGKMTMSEIAKKQAIEEAKKQNPQGAQVSPDMIETMMNSMEYPLTLREDNTFTLTLVMFPAEGTWKFENGKVVMTVTKMMGMDINALAAQSGQTARSNDPMVLSVSKDGKTMTGASSAAVYVGGSFTFTKKD